MKLFLDWVGRDPGMEEIPFATPEGQAVVGIILELTNGHRFEISESVDGTGLRVCLPLGHFTTSIYSRKEIILRAGL